MTNQHANGVNANVIIAFVVGAAAGVAAGLLMAPDKGTATRDRLLHAIKDLDLEALGLSDLKNKVSAKAKSLSRQAKDAVDDAAENLSH